MFRYVFFFYPSFLCTWLYNHQLRQAWHKQKFSSLCIPLCHCCTIRHFCICHYFSNHLCKQCVQNKYWLFSQLFCVGDVAFKCVSFFKVFLISQEKHCISLYIPSLYNYLNIFALEICWYQLLNAPIFFSFFTEYCYFQFS